MSQRMLELTYIYSVNVINLLEQLLQCTEIGTTAQRVDECVN